MSVLAVSRLVDWKKKFIKTVLEDNRSDILARKIEGTALTYIEPGYVKIE